MFSTFLQYTCACSVASVVSDSVTLCTVACQASWSMGFSRQEYWSGLPGPLLGDLPDPGMEPSSPALQADSLPLRHQRSPVNFPQALKCFFFFLSQKKRNLIRSPPMADLVLSSPVITLEKECLLELEERVG